METSNKFLTERRYDIDWIRAGLIFSVFLFHIGMFFNGFGWHLKNNEKVLWLNPLMAFLHNWRMPLLFFISGAGTYFALGKRTIGGFAGERARKLLIPLIFGMFFIVPPQVYVEKHEQYGSFLNFIPHLAEGSYPVGNFSWHHLWFVLYLFVCAMVAIPVILLLRSEKGNAIYEAVKKLSSGKWFVFMLALPLSLSQILLRPYFPEETHALVNDWAYISYNFLFFIYGYILLSRIEVFDNITKNRRFFALVSLLFTILFFFDYYHSIDPYIPNSIQLYLKACGDLVIGLTVTTYAATYLNRDHPIRRHINEGIYPFYILHQTVIIVIGFYLYNLTMNVGLKALILTLGSLITCISLFLLIRSFNLTRVLFGMPVKKK
jgi:hypothetical protein